MNILAASAILFLFVSSAQASLNVCEVVFDGAAIEVHFDPAAETLILSDEQNIFKSQNCEHAETLTEAQKKKFRSELPKLRAEIQRAPLFHKDRLTNIYQRYSRLET